MDADQLPRPLWIRVIACCAVFPRIEDAEAAERAFSLLMGSEVVLVRVPTLLQSVGYREQWI